MRRLLSAAAFVLTTLLVAGCGPEMHYVASDPTVRAPKPREYDMPFSYEAPDRPTRSWANSGSAKKSSQATRPPALSTGSYSRCGSGPSIWG